MKHLISVSIKPAAAHTDPGNQRGSLLQLQTVRDRQRIGVALVNRYVAANTPREAASVSDAEFVAMSPERMLEQAELVDKIFAKSPDQWSPPEVTSRASRERGCCAAKEQQREGAIGRACGWLAMHGLSLGRESPTPMVDDVDDVLVSVVSQLHRGERVIPAEVHAADPRGVIRDIEQLKQMIDASEIGKVRPSPG